MAIVTNPAQPTAVEMPEKYLHKRGDIPTVNLGPLTTTFEPPDDCDVLTVKTLAYLPGNKPTFYYDFVYGNKCEFYDRRLHPVSSCFPPRYASAYSGVKGYVADMILPVFSPGLACPSGYQSICTFYANSTRASGRWLDYGAQDTVGGTYISLLKERETGIGCCPSNYLCDQLYECGSIAQGGETLTAADNYECYNTDGKTTSYEVDSDLKVTIHAPMVMLVQGEAISTTSTAAEQTSTAASDASDTPNEMASEKESSGLSSGAIAGIAIGAVLAVIFMAVAAFLLIRRRRKRLAGELADESKTEPGSNRGILDWMRGNETAAGGNSSAGPTSPSELDATTNPRHSRGVSTVMSENTAGSDGKRLSELHGASSVASPRLHGSIIELPVEMEGSSGQTRTAPGER